MNKLESIFALAMKVFTGACFVLIVVLVVANIIARGAANAPDVLFAGPDWSVPFARAVMHFLKGLSASWFDEITQLLTAWMVFIGAAALWRERAHFRAEIVDTILKGRAGQVLGLGVTLFSLIFFLVMTYYGIVLAERITTSSSILQWPRAWWIASVPAGGAIMVLYCAYDLVAGLIGLATGRDLARRATVKEVKA